MLLELVIGIPVGFAALCGVALHHVRAEDEMLAEIEAKERAQTADIKRRARADEEAARDAEARRARLALGTEPEQEPKPAPQDPPRFVYYGQCAKEECPLCITSIPNLSTPTMARLVNGKTVMVQSCYDCNNEWIIDPFAPKPVEDEDGDEDEEEDGDEDD